MKLFAVAQSARKNENSSVTIYTKPGGIVAESGDEAVGIALRMARQDWPLDQGYTDHTASATELDVDKALTLLGRT
jgi:hypothetical protein